MSKITFSIREDGREYYTRYYELELDTEDFENIDEMRQYAEDNYPDGDAGDTDYNDSETDEVKLDDDNYSGDSDDYEWKKDETATIVNSPESAIQW